MEISTKPTHPRFTSAGRWFALSLAVIACWYIAFFILTLEYPIAMESFCRPRKSRPFSTTEWISGTNPVVKLEMANDLLKKKSLMNLTRPEVTRMLGEPPSAQATPHGEILFYGLCRQRIAPASFPLIPDSWFGNFELWILYVHFRSNAVVKTHIRPN